MRMWRLSASRQPCSAGSCIAGARDLVSRAKNTPDVRPPPYQTSGLRRNVGNPHRHAVIMRDRKPQALRRECKAADGREHVKRFFLNPPAADKGGLAGRPRHGPIWMKRDIVDPAPFWVGGEW